MLRARKGVVQREREVHVRRRCRGAARGGTGSSGDVPAWPAVVVWRQLVAVAQRVVPGPPTAVVLLGLLVVLLLLLLVRRLALRGVPVRKFTRCDGGTLTVFLVVVRR